MSNARHFDSPLLLSLSTDGLSPPDAQKLREFRAGREIRFEVRKGHEVLYSSGLSADDILGATTPATRNAVVRCLPGLLIRAIRGAVPSADYPLTLAVYRRRHQEKTANVRQALS